MKASSSLRIAGGEQCCAPAFSQVDIPNDPVQRAFAEGHNAFVACAESIGQPGCSMPGSGLLWQPTRQPVALRRWPASPGSAVCDQTARSAMAAISIEHISSKEFSGSAVE